MRKYIPIFIIIILIIVNFSACNDFVTGNNTFRSSKYYLTVQLPVGWEAAKGPVDIIPTGHAEIQVAFNSRDQADFFAQAVEEQLPDGGLSYKYNKQTVMAQIPSGGAYIALVRSYPPGGLLTSPPDEYTLNDLSGLLEPHDWRLEWQGAEFISFYKWGRVLELEVCCQSDASDDTISALNELLASWRFDDIPEGDILWAHSQAIKLLPEKANPMNFR